MRLRCAVATLLAALAAMPGAASAGDAKQTSAQWVTLGTSGGPSVQPERAQISNALVIGDAVYLFDTGNDVQRQLAKAGIAERKLRAVFLSHHHLDHNADLGPVIVTHWLFGAGKLGVFGPAGTVHLARGLAEANEPTALASFPTAGPARPAIADTIAASDLPDGMTEPQPVYTDENIRVTAITVDHFQTPPSVPLPRMPQAVAYRVEAGGRSFVYSGDTGPSAGLEKLARGADLLVSEVVDLDGIAAQLARSMANVPAPVRDNVVRGMKVNHLTTDTIGRIAATAGVKQVVLTHFVPVPEQLPDPAKLVGGVKARYNGPVTLARDLDRF